MMVKNGDLVYCTNHHVVCEVVDASKLLVANRWAEAFGKWRMGQAPEAGGQFPVCLLCGAEIKWPDAHAMRRADAKLAQSEGCPDVGVWAIATGLMSKEEVEKRFCEIMNAPLKSDP